MKSRIGTHPMTTFQEFRDPLRVFTVGNIRGNLCHFPDIGSNYVRHLLIGRAILQLSCVFFFSQLENLRASDSSLPAPINMLDPRVINSGHPCKDLQWDIIRETCISNQSSSSHHSSQMTSSASSRLLCLSKFTVIPGLSFINWQKLNTDPINISDTQEKLLWSMSKGIHIR